MRNSACDEALSAGHYARAISGLRERKLNPKMQGGFSSWVSYLLSSTNEALPAPAVVALRHAIWKKRTISWQGFFSQRNLAVAHGERKKWSVSMGHETKPGGFFNSWRPREDSLAQQGVVMPLRPCSTVLVVFHRLVVRRLLSRLSGTIRLQAN